MNAELKKFLTETPLDNLGEVFGILAGRVGEHRKSNRGFVPLPIFPYCVALGGVYPCVEVIPHVYSPYKVGNPDYVLLKRREGTEQGWQGFFQIPGVSGRMTDSPDDIFGRLAKEMFGPEADKGLLEPSFVGIEIHDEPERQAVCWTIVYQMTFTKHPSGLVGEWKEVVTPYGHTDIVSHHCATLEWFFDPNRPKFADLRGGYKKSA